MLKYEINADRLDISIIFTVNFLIKSSLKLTYLGQAHDAVLPFYFFLMPFLYNDWYFLLT